MKPVKLSKKLHLNRESVRSLSSNDLDSVKGGGSISWRCAGSWDCSTGTDTKCAYDQNCGGYTGATCNGTYTCGSGL